MSWFDRVMGHGGGGDQQAAPEQPIDEQIRDIDRQLEAIRKSRRGPVPYNPQADEPQPPSATQRGEREIDELTDAQVERLRQADQDRPKNMLDMQARAAFMSKHGVLPEDNTQTLRLFLRALNKR